MNQCDYRLGIHFSVTLSNFNKQKDLTFLQNIQMRLLLDRLYPTPKRFLRNTEDPQQINLFF